jgi:acyl-CoA thioester hydrolase
MGEQWVELYRSVVMPAHCDLYGHMNVRHYAAFFDDAGFTS